MDSQRNIAVGLFDNLATILTGGLIPDIQTAIMSIAGILLILFALDIVLKIINDTAPSERVSEWWEKSGEAQKKKRPQKDSLISREGSVSKVKGAHK